MQGTLALWFEPFEIADDKKSFFPAKFSRKPEEPEFYPNSIELHINIWRDLDESVNFLDVGVRFLDASSIRSFAFYLPAPIQLADIKDLGQTMRSGLTLNAVFNDVVKVGTSGDRYYNIQRSGIDDRVFILDEGDFSVREDNDPSFGHGSIITFSERLGTDIRECPTSSYIRFRIRLEGAAAELFSSEITARDAGFVSSPARLELTECRLNERRSIPKSILEANDRGKFNIQAIHYFLIRDFEHQLFMQHSHFDKVRRLEGQIWSDYLANTIAQAEDRISKITEKMLIYHWKVKAKGKNESIGDFVAFASFMTAKTSLAYYAIVIVLLGAAGSMGATIIAGWLSKLVAFFAKSFNWDSSENIALGYPMLSAFIGCILMAIVIYGVAAIQRSLSTRKYFQKKSFGRNSSGRIPFLSRR